MGLLDEAIREHLELKRRSGADPSAIAREEHEALAPVLDDDVELGDDESVPDGLDVVETLPAAAVPVQELEVEEEEEVVIDFSSVGQETAELDMQALMEEDPDAADSAAPLGPVVDEPTPPPYSGEGSGGDAAEWGSRDEVDPEAAPEDVPGQERLTFE
jgi:hypothetical protein